MDGLFLRRGQNPRFLTFERGFDAGGHASVGGDGIDPQRVDAGFDIGQRRVPGTIRTDLRSADRGIVEVDLQNFLADGPPRQGHIPRSIIGNRVDGERRVRPRVLQDLDPVRPGQQHTRRDGGFGGGLRLSGRRCGERHGGFGGGGWQFGGRLKGGQRRGGGRRNRHFRHGDDRTLGRRHPRSGGGCSHEAGIRRRGEFRHRCRPGGRQGQIYRFDNHARLGQDVCRSGRRGERHHPVMRDGRQREQGDEIGGGIGSGFGHGFAIDHDSHLRARLGVAGDECPAFGVDPHDIEARGQHRHRFFPRDGRRIRFGPGRIGRRILSERGCFRQAVRCLRPPDHEDAKRDDHRCNRPQGPSHPTRQQVAHLSPLARIPRV